MRIFVLPAVAVLSTLLVLTGCAASAPIAPVEPSGAESSSLTPSAPRIQSLSEIAGTAWTGTDSDGDLNIFTFNEDGIPSTIQQGEVAVGRDDRWSVEGDILTFTIDYGADIGIATYTATFDVETQVLSAEATTTGGSTGSVELRRTSY